MGDVTADHQRQLDVTSLLVLLLETDMYEVFGEPHPIWWGGGGIFWICPGLCDLPGGCRGMLLVSVSTKLLCTDSVSPSAPHCPKDGSIVVT